MQFDALLFGSRLKDERERLGLSQQEAADLAGVRREMWGKYERGAAEPGLAPIERFCAHGASIMYLLSGANQSTEPPDLMSELKRYGDAWQIVVTFLANTGKTLPPARQRAIAEELYRVTTPEMGAAEVIDELARLAA